MQYTGRLWRSFALCRALFFALLSFFFYQYSTEKLLSFATRHVQILYQWKNVLFDFFLIPVYELSYSLGISFFLVRSYAVIEKFREEIQIELQRNKFDFTSRREFPSSYCLDKSKRVFFCILNNKYNCTK